MAAPTIDAKMRICPQCGTQFEDNVQFCPHDGSPTQVVAGAPAAVTDALLGQVIDGRYRVEQKIGEGGMGVVYSATHTTLQKKLALKVLRGDHSKDKEVVERFVQEARAATSIGHQNIINISDFGRLPDGSVYFVMEFLGGCSLTDMIKRGGAIPSADAMHIIRQIASALEAAHARGIVHRDLKPDNIQLITQGEEPLFVKVLDFGIAKVGGASSKLTKTGMVFGTPHYMSPEQAAGHSVDRRADIYALGIIMYEMYAGKVPFDSDTMMGILSKHMFESPVNPSVAKGADLGPIESVILKTLAKKPDDRYGSMTELLDDLATVSSGGSVHYEAPPPVAPPGAPPGAPPPGAFHPSVPPTVDVLPRGIPKGVLIGGGLFALLTLAIAVGGVAFYLAGSGEESEDAAVVGTLPEGEPSSVSSIGPGATPEPGTETLGVAVQPTSAQPTPAQPTPNPTELRADSVLDSPAVAVPVMVQITTDPAGAEVLSDGTLLGHTPFSVARPSAEPQQLELRLARHQSRTIMLTSSSGPSLNVRLERESRRPRPRTRRPASRPVTGPTPAPSRPVRSSAPSSDVLDPWGN